MSFETFAGDRYRVERPLAEGGMADVYLAHDTALERLVAIKVLAETLANDNSLRKRFAREARMAAALQHPNIVAVFDTGEQDGRPFIVMEFVEGSTLADRLRVEGRLSPAEVVAIGLQVCAGLARAHAAGLVHRDIKPGNLLLRSDGTVKIADFGIASAAELTSVTEAGTILGTAAYLAPEQAAGEPATPRSDVYGLGAALYEALAGRPPFHFQSLADLVDSQRRRAVEPPSRFAPEVPEQLDRVVLRCLASDPGDRPGSAEELAAELGAASPTADAAATRVGAPQSEALTRPMRPVRRVPRRLPGLAPVVGLLAVLAVGGLATGLILSRGDSNSHQPPAIDGVAPGGPPAEQARNLAAWLRDNAEPAP